ncbi:DUF308 domain-containing protein [Candidatus Saccharibacteria bacterium]|nr:DUF308 domain-containing protein [Candidatus Saccharibacteria bacterium]
MDAEMSELQAHWWALTFRGIAAVLFGIAAVFWPGITLLTLLYIFSAWVLVDGVIRIVNGVGRIGKNQLGFLTMVVGLVQLGVGVYLLRHPAVSFATLILLIGFTLIISGVAEFVASLSSDDSSTGKTLTAIVGVAAVLAGILMLFQPAKSGVAFVWILGLYALITGPLLIAMSMDVRKMVDSGSRRKR